MTLSIRAVRPQSFRPLVALGVAIALGACGAPTPAGAPGVAPVGAPGAEAGLPADCAMVVTGAVAFTGAGPSDTIEARSLPAASCDQSVLVFSLRARDGRLLYTYAAPYGQMSQSEPGKGLKPALQAWAAARVDDTSAAPAWAGGPDGAPTAFGQQGGTPFLQPVYEGIRSAKRPRLCFSTSYEAYRCLYFEAESGQAGELFSASP